MSSNGTAGMLSELAKQKFASKVIQQREAYS
jgi:hypothetical protein